MSYVTWFSLPESREAPSFIFPGVLPSTPSDFLPYENLRLVRSFSTTEYIEGNNSFFHRPPSPSFPLETLFSPQRMLSADRSPFMPSFFSLFCRPTMFLNTPFIRRPQVFSSNFTFGLRSPLPYANFTALTTSCLQEICISVMSASDSVLIRRLWISFLCSRLFFFTYIGDNRLGLLCKPSGLFVFPPLEFTAFERAIPFAVDRNFGS